MPSFGHSLWKGALDAINLIDNAYRRTILPFSIVVGLPGQIITIVIFLIHSEWEATCKVYYLTMAFADFAYLLFYALPEFAGDGLTYWLGHHIYWLNVVHFSNLTCKLLRFIWHTSWFVSYWTLVIYSYERLIVISYPLIRTRYITIKLAKQICFVLVGFTLIVFSVIFYGDVYIVLDESKSLEFHYCFLNVSGISSLIFVWFALLFLGTILFPPIFLIISNISLFKKLNVIMQERKNLHKRLRKGTQPVANVEIKSAKELIILSTITLILSFPTTAWLIVASSGLKY